MATSPSGTSPFCTALRTSRMEGYGKGCRPPSGMLARRASSVNVPSGPRKATLSLPCATPAVSSVSLLRSYPLGYQTTPGARGGERAAGG